MEVATAAESLHCISKNFWHTRHKTCNVDNVIFSALEDMSVAHLHDHRVQNLTVGYFLL